MDRIKALLAEIDRRCMETWEYRRRMAEIVPDVVAQGMFEIGCKADLDAFWATLLYLAEYPDHMSGEVASAAEKLGWSVKSERSGGTDCKGLSAFTLTHRIDERRMLQAKLRPFLNNGQCRHEYALSFNVLLDGAGNDILRTLLLRGIDVTVPLVKGLKVTTLYKGVSGRRVIDRSGVVPQGAIVMDAINVQWGGEILIGGQAVYRSSNTGNWVEIEELAEEA